MQTHTFKPASQEPTVRQKTRLELNCSDPLEIFNSLYILIEEIGGTDIKISKRTWKITFKGGYLEENEAEDEQDEWEDS